MPKARKPKTKAAKKKVGRRRRPAVRLPKPICSYEEMQRTVRREMTSFRKKHGERHGEFWKAEFFNNLDLNLPNGGRRAQVASNRALDRNWRGERMGKKPSRFLLKLT